MRSNNVTILAILLAVALTLPACRKNTPPPQPAAAPAKAQPTSAVNEIVIVAEPIPVPESKFVASSTPAVPTSIPISAPAAASQQSVAGAQAAIAHQPFDLSEWNKIRATISAAASQSADNMAKNPRAFVIVGDHALSQNDYLAARRAFQQACNLAPTDIDALQGLAVTLVVIEDYKPVVPVYERIIALCPPDAARSTQPTSAPAGIHAKSQTRHTAQFNLANALARLGRFDDSVAVYQDLLADNPQFIQAKFNLATVYQAQNRLAQAAAAWQEVIDAADNLAPADAAVACSMRGQLLLDLDKPQEAMAAYVLATKFTPDDPVAWLNLSAAAQASGSLGRAIAAVRQAIKLTPRDEECYNRLGDALLELHKLRNDRQSLQDAIDAWQKSIDINPSQPTQTKKIERYKGLLERTGQ